MCFYERTCSGSSGRNAGTAGKTSRKAGLHEGALFGCTLHTDCINVG